MKTSIIRRVLLLPALALTLLATGSLLEGYTTGGRSWATSTVHYYVNAQNRWVSANAAVTAIQTAAAVWRDQSHANIQLLYAGSTSGSSLTLNYKSEVFFRGGAMPYVAEGYYWWDGSGRLVDGDIVFYEDAYQFFAGSGCSNGVYIENVAAHEFGHILGLLHSEVPGVTMQPSMQSYCDMTQMTLEPDDVAAIESLYPPTTSGPVNTAPAVTIAAPGSNSSFAEATTITFSGSANDTQDGGISGSLRWTSNLSGQIGVGASFSRTLPAGVHVITAVVTDSAGASNSRQVTITVSSSAQPPTPPPSSGPSLSARGYKVKGMQRVDLSWSGVEAGSVDVFRNNSKVATLPNSGAGTDPIDKKGGGNYSYRVCVAGNSSTCSNAVSVVF